MFQYAAGVGLAQHRAGRVVLDLSAFAAYATWPYQLDKLRVPQDISAGEPLSRPTGRSLPARIARRLTGGVKASSLYLEPHFHFDEQFFALSGDEIRLEGYFQSPLYFAGCEAVLRQRFQPAEPFGVAAQTWAERIDAVDRSVSLHVRRGDYVTNPSAAAVHAVLGEGYYGRAIALIHRLLGGDVDFFLFSDEPDFVQEAFAGLPRAHVVRTDPARSWEDMFLMARCSHHIIANSSYSWWGAWLNPSPEKVVIAPGQWFTRHKLAMTNVMDLYPEDWIILK
ncbi:Glycosyl transferase family 11 [Chelatococcus sambhunathii]|uniref:Glycosyl transferase family 11 n=1 Tax=Chelatococcus sambhunathii TaxID=363953 RepID=A0ABM9U2I3_9HYPH|nr:alpha-1,2-fucosyltransferase [Chelatococcus sambhunathii]CUA86810.1 Glycosyl transferase family 11 [Chelatococcus sambhunathii]